MDNRIAAGKTRPFIIVIPYDMTNEVRPGAPWAVPASAGTNSKPGALVHRVGRVSMPRP
jgi:hypothetical protein